MTSPRARCEEVVVQVVIRSYDDRGRPIGEATCQPIKVFRAQALNFWHHIDTLVAESLKATPAPPAAPPPSRRPKK